MDAPVYSRGQGGAKAKTVWVIAHRGASGSAPENTLAAFRRAVELGAGFIETDLQLSRDTRLVALHEGGYSTAYVPFCGLAVVEELAGRRSSVTDPILPAFQNMPGQTLQQHQRTVIDRAAELVGRVQGPRQEASGPKI